MKSLILQRFSNVLENPEVLNNPEDFLGPNTEKLLDFWNKIEKLSKEQLEVVEKRYRAFYNENYSEWEKAAGLAWDTSNEVVGAKYVNNAGSAAYGFTNFDVAEWATLEIIGGVENPVFLLMFDNQTESRLSSSQYNYYKQKISLILEAAPNFKRSASELTKQLNHVINSASLLSEEEKDNLWSYILENRQKMFNYYIVELNKQFYWLDEEIQKFEDGSRIIKLTPTDKIY